MVKDFTSLPAGRQGCTKNAQRGAEIAFKFPDPLCEKTLCAL